MNELFRRETDLHIQQLTVENPAESNTLPFDPERDITEADWQNILQFIKERIGNLQEVLPRIYDVLILFPERRADLGLTAAMAESTRNTFMQLPYDSTRISNHQVDLLKIARARVVFPDLMDYTDLFPVFRDKVVQRLQESKDDTAGLIVFSAIFKRAFPTEADAMLAEYWPRFREDYRTIEKAFVAEPTDTNIDDFQDSLYRMRLIFPQHLDELQAPKAFWPVAKETLDLVRPIVSEFLRHAVTYKAIVAEEVIVDEHGIQLNLQRSYDSSEPEKRELPEQRRY